MELKKQYEGVNQVANGETEILSAILQLDVKDGQKIADLNQLNAALERVNSELDRYTNKADKSDYAFAVFSGLLAGAIDVFLVGESTINEQDFDVSREQIKRFIENYANKRDLQPQNLQDAIAKQEKRFTVAQDNSWSGANIKVGTKNHHLADLAHHPTPVGLAAAIVVQFLRVGTFVDRDGKWHFLFVDKNSENNFVSNPKAYAEFLIDIWTPVVITGVLNWLVAVADAGLDEDGEASEALKRISHLIASTPLIIEIAKCADNWFGHLVSDMGGSKKTAGGGMGIPGVFVSLLHEVSALPVLKDTGLPQIVNDLYTKQKIDLRHELPDYKLAEKQSIPVAVNEIIVRLGFFVAHLAEELGKHPSVKEINWDNVIPFNNRTVDRMLAVASMTFTVADTTDAAVHAALESGGNWVLFSGRFVSRTNYVGAGRAVIAVVKEVSNEQKEMQLIHEKRILSEAKAELYLEALQQYKEQLEEKVTNYLAEDIEAFMAGFDFMNEGLATGNSELVIKGNVIIQKVLGREPQFSSQREFDDLMESDAPLAF